MTDKVIRRTDRDTNKHEFVTLKFTIEKIHLSTALTRTTIETSLAEGHAIRTLGFIYQHVNFVTD